MSRRLLVLAGLAALPLLVLGLFFMVPVAGMLALGLLPEGSFDAAGVLEVLTRSRVHRVLWFTLWSSVLGTVLALLLGVPVAHLLHRTRLPGRRIARAALLVPFVLPTVVVGIAFRQLLVPSGPLGFLGLDGTPVAIVAAMAFFNVAVVVRTVGAAWESLDRRPGEAAAALGAAPATVFRTVTLPALRPAIVAAGSVVFLFCSTAFGIVLVLGGARYATVETEIYRLTVYALDLQAAAALSLLQLLIIAGLLLAAHRTTRGRHGHSRRLTADPAPLRRTDAPALGAALLVLLLVGLPLAALLVGSLRVGEGWGLANYARLAGDGQAAGGSGDALLVPVTEAMATSLRTAVDATWMALGVGLLVAFAVTRRSRTRAEQRLRSVLDGLFLLPLGVSAVTLGFGFLVTLDEPPLALRDSPLLVPLAQALVALPLVVRTLTPVLAGIDDRLRQAAASLGASPWQAVVTVDLPQLWRPVLAAAGFCFAISLGEFGATSFLARDEHPTVPVVIFQLLGHPGEHNYGMALAASVVLAATTAVVVLAVERLRVPQVGGF